MANESQVDPKLKSEIRKYGEFDVKGCYACGSCLVSCPLSGDSSSFPRKSISYAQIGLKKPLIGNLEPWLCYYCGDCSTTCPQQTEPGEAMMTLRRYLTSKYDWTGLSAKMYQSKLWQIGALLGVGLVLAILAALFQNNDLLKFGHVFEMSAIFSVALFIIIPNVLRMAWFTMIRGNEQIKIPIILYLTELKTLIYHAVIQIRFKECTDKSRWLKHWLVAAGYILMLTMVVFLDWFHTIPYPFYRPEKWLGYLVIIVLVIFTAEIIIGRIKKREAIHKFSHLSDWLFPVWLFMMALTALLAHLLLSLGFIISGHYLYIFHLIVLGQWALVFVPFGKWPHLLYRPLAIYFHAVKKKAFQRQMSREADLRLAQPTT